MTHIVLGVLHEGSKFTDGYFILTHSERLGYRDFMLRTFTITPASFTTWGAHHELAGGHNHYFRAFVTVAKHLSGLKRPRRRCGQYHEDHDNYGGMDAMSDSTSRSRFTHDGSYAHGVVPL